MKTKLMSVPAATLTSCFISTFVILASAQIYPGTLYDTNNTISVTGLATQKVVPNRAGVTLAVETMNKTAGGALSNRQRAKLDRIRSDQFPLD
jgi:uncharacterized protein YggE